MNTRCRVGKNSQCAANGLGAASRGVSLIEVMVALTAGLILLAGVSSIYLGTKQTSRMQEAQARLQEDGRFTLEFLKNSVRIAGYRDVPWVLHTTAFPLSIGGDTQPNFSSVGQIVTGVYGSGKGTAAAQSDALSIRFLGTAQTNDSATDCQGAAIGGGVLALKTFRVDSTNSLPNRHELECILNTNTPQPVVSGFGSIAGVPLILFGYDSDGDRSANQYLPAASVASWLDVVSVRITFRLVSQEDNLSSVSETYTLNGQTFNDRRLKRTFTTTIALRNSLP